MMAYEKRCQYCGKTFVPNGRIGLRQKSCSEPCRKLLKRESNRRFGRRNPGYWLGRYDVVRAWRKNHPGYQREWRRRCKERQSGRSSAEIQAQLFIKAVDTVQESVYLLREIQAEIPTNIFDIQRCLVNDRLLAA